MRRFYLLESIFSWMCAYQDNFPESQEPKILCCTEQRLSPSINLALYHLAAAHPEESDRLYTSNLTAPIEWLQMAIDDLDDFLQLFPDHSQAQQVKQLLKGAIGPKAE
jgi:hypothetical protein